MIDAAIGFVPMSLWLPYAHYRRSHLAHHVSRTITDPHADPELRYVDQACGLNWLATPAQATLIGPPTKAARFVLAEIAAARREPLSGSSNQSRSRRSPQSASGSERRKLRVRLRRYLRGSRCTHALTLLLGDGRQARTTFQPSGTGTVVTTTFDAESENAADLQQQGWQAILNNYRKRAKELAER